MVGSGLSRSGKKTEDQLIWSNPKNIHTHAIYSYDYISDLHCANSRENRTANEIQ